MTDDDRIAQILGNKTRRTLGNLDMLLLALGIIALIGVSFVYAQGQGAAKDLAHLESAQAGEIARLEKTISKSCA